MATLFVKGGNIAGHAQRTAKYRNQWAEYGGQKYQSKKEATYAANLDLQVCAGLIRGWRRQVRVPLVVNKVLICNLVVDFLEIRGDGALIYTEIKSGPTMTRDWKLKWKLFEALYPELIKQVVK